MLLGPGQNGKLVPYTELDAKFRSGAGLPKPPRGNDPLGPKTPGGFGSAPQAAPAAQAPAATPAKKLVFKPGSLGKLAALPRPVKIGLGVAAVLAVGGALVAAGGAGKRKRRTTPADVFEGWSIP